MPLLTCFTSKGLALPAIARYLHDAGTTIFGLDLSSRMIEQARQLNPDISFREGDMMALDIPDATLAGIAAFYAIVD